MTHEEIEELARRFVEKGPELKDCIRLAEACLQLLNEGKVWLVIVRELAKGEFMEIDENGVVHAVRRTPEQLKPTVLRNPEGEQGAAR